MSRNNIQIDLYTKSTEIGKPFDLEKQQREREKFCSEVLEINKSNNLIAIQAATGIGKGFCVFKSIEQDTSSKKWLILVPEILQIENMKEDIKKHNFLHLYDKIEDIICYASFDKFKGRELNLWCNEVHRLSELKSDISQTLIYDKIIVDSATIPFKVKERLKSLGDFIFIHLPLKEAIERGILPEPSVYKVEVMLDDKIKRNEKMYGDKQAFLTDKSYAEVLDTDLEYWKERFAKNPKEQWIENKLNSIGSTRKKFFTDRKTEKLKELLRDLGNRRYICFTGSIEQCDEVGRQLAVHSKKSKKHNIKTLEDFNNYEIFSIFMNRMGREGLNLSGIEAGIVVQLGTGNDEGLEFLQSFGRSLRSNSPEFYLFYCKGTKDEDFLNKALKNIDEKFVKEYITETKI